jgi:glycosyltransferase involved in cell wall biosynthesis
MSDVQLPRSKQRLRIGFVHRFDARSIRSWSGIFFFMSQALEAHVGEVVYLGPDDSAGTRFIVDNIARMNRLWTWLTGSSLATDHNRVLSRRLGRFFERRLREEPCDILFSPVGSVEIANLRTDLPIVYYSDLTWNQIVEYYPDYSSICAFGRAEGERIEAAAIRRANAAVYPSQWAADSACDHYKASRETTSKVSFGANLNEPPSRDAALNRSVSNTVGTVNLLLVGVDWIRKGGSIALECLNGLLDSGIDAQLTILGCKPPAGIEHPRMRVIPFLSKHDPEQRKQIVQLFLDAHFMLLPTRADATPIVTCEASAFGLPTLATDTGGLRGSITDGVNGFLLPPEALGRTYADKIISVIADPPRYHALVVSSRDEYEKNLNWDAWGRSMRSIMERVLNHKIDPGELPHDAQPAGTSDKHPVSSRQGTPSLEAADSLPAEVSHI